VLREFDEEGEKEAPQPLVYPTITDGEIEIYMPWLSADARLYDDLGRQYFPGRYRNDEYPAATCIVTGYVFYSL
jgi:hypothetical protein